jgi:hypothetical protein
VRAEGEVRVDLGGEILACGGTGPCASVLQVELNGLACVHLPVSRLGVQRVVQDTEPGPGLPGEVSQAESAALLHGPHRGLVPEPGDEVIARVLAEERYVLVGLHLISRQHHGDVVASGVSLPLPVHAEALAGGLGDQDGQVEASEQPGRERVSPGSAVHHHILAGTVNEVVEVQLDRAGLGVVAGHAEVVLTERTGGQQSRPAGGGDG